MNAYIEHGSCSAQLVEWNQDYGRRTMAGETPRSFYYRVLGYLDWGACGRPFFRPILNELQKAWLIFASAQISEAEFEAKEAELINLFFTALQSDKRGAQLVRDYESTTAARLLDATPTLQYSTCTFFGERPRCTD